MLSFTGVLALSFGTGAIVMAVQWMGAMPSQDSCVVAYTLQGVHRWEPGCLFHSWCRYRVVVHRHAQRLLCCHVVTAATHVAPSVWYYDHFELCPFCPARCVKSL